MLIDGQISTTPPKLQIERSEQLCLKKKDTKKCGSKVAGSRRLLLSMSLWNDWHTILLTGANMKPPKYINYALVECYLFLKRQGKMEGCLVMIYIQVQIYECEGKISMFQWKWFVIHKLMISFMIEFYLHNIF